MTTTPEIPDISPEAAQRAFHDHLIQKAHAARLKYGLYIDAEVIVQMLSDSDVVRYPTTLHFDKSMLQPHEFGHAHPLGFHSADGFALFIHPAFARHSEALPLLVAYHIPSINYGRVVDAEGAELFGATLVGMEAEAYYQALCELADSIGAASASEPPAAP